MPSPTASTTPAPSWCGIWNPSIGRGVDPPRDFQSVGLTPEYSTLTLTSPGPGAGRSTSSIRKTSVLAPYRSKSAARMLAPPGLLAWILVWPGSDHRTALGWRACHEQAQPPRQAAWQVWLTTSW